MPVSLETYIRVALEDDDRWEWIRGRLRKKPAGTVEHNGVIRQLSYELHMQLPKRQFTPSVNMTRIRIARDIYLVPDLCVIPRELIERALRERPHEIEVYDESMPLVVEAWSEPVPAFDHDDDEKLTYYREHGDAEIWRIHPYEKTLIAWRRQPDGSYTETLYREGQVSPASLPGAVIDLAELFR